MDEIPVVRHFIACVAIEPSSSPHSVTLRDIIYAIVRLPGEPFPCIRDKMSLFAILTNGRGIHEFTIELSRFDRGEERLVRPAWGPVQRDLGQDPTVVHGFPITLGNIVFQDAGQFIFRLFCDGQAIAEEQILVR